jgi:hypothetical protein
MVDFVPDADQSATTRWKKDAFPRQLFKMLREFTTDNHKSVNPGSPIADVLLNPELWLCPRFSKTHYAEAGHPRVYRTLARRQSIQARRRHHARTQR